MKNKTLDVLVKAKDKLINIEVNSGYYNSLDYRNSVYIFEKYTEVFKAGDKYSNKIDVIQINFTSGLPKDAPVIDECQYGNLKTGKVKVKNLISYEYNLDKIKEMCYNGNKKYNYIAALDFEQKDLEKYCKGDEYMERFEKEVNKLNTDIEFTEFLSAEEDNERLKNTLIYEAEEKGKAEGMIEGKTEGILTVARNMLGLNMNIEDIMKVTGLTEKEILALKENNG